MRALFFLALFLLLWSCNAPTSSTIHLDTLLLNAQVHDGTAKTPYTADVGLIADTIAFIGDSQKQNFKTNKTIDLNGFLLAPGFVDTHTHALADLSDSLKNSNLNYLFQGVTTVLTGSDGGSVVYIGKTLEEWEKQGIGTNAAIMVGHRTIRNLVMGGRDDVPTAEEMTNMKTLVARGIDEGALGFSTGLYYAPASFATTEEVIELAKVAANKNGIYDAHIRDESSYSIGLIAAIEESIHIAKEADIPVNISHIKALGVDVWDKSDEVIALIEKARKEGLKITADQYPYQASGTHLNRALLSKWVFADERPFEEKYSDPKLKQKIEADITENLRRRGGAESILIIAAAQSDTLNGKNLAEIANNWQLTPVQAAIEIIKNGSAAIASFNMKAADIENFMKKEWVMTCSDGSNAHPRKYGTYPKKIREYVLEKKVLTMEEMIRKSTRFPARTYQIPHRGEIKVGYFADLIVFKPEKVKDRATFISPAEYAEGMEYVFVNGVMAIEKGRYTGALAGRAIRK